jgi:hypothetical protein
MIEVLVASTILIVLVMMLAMLFQQTGAAWRTGVKRADGYMQIRALVGAVQRDAASAVAEETIPQTLRSLLPGAQQFTGNTLSFYTLTGTGFKDPANPRSSQVLRALKFVSYNLADGTRTEQTLGGDLKSSDVFNIAKRSGNKNAAVTRVNAVQVQRPDSPPPGSSSISISLLPLYIRFQAVVTTMGYALDIGAESAGPDKTWDTDDDIRTWSK